MVGLVSFGNQAKLFRKIGDVGAYPQLLFTVNDKASGNLVDVVVVVMARFPVVLLEREQLSEMDCR